jgi:DNA-binding transcriptional regulator YdaS (Cro superfamily)
MLSTRGMSESIVDDTEIEEATRRARAVMGPSALARALSESGRPLSPQAVSLWTKVPPERVLEVERLTGVSRHELRPDVFGAAA